MGARGFRFADDVATGSDVSLPGLIAKNGEAFVNLESADLDGLLRRIGDARVVLTGEATPRHIGVLSIAGAHHAKPHRKGGVGVIYRPESELAELDRIEEAAWAAPGVAKVVNNVRISLP